MASMEVPKYGVNWFSLMYSTQKSEDHWIGVSPVLAGVTFMSATAEHSYTGVDLSPFFDRAR
jgi:hypothetical protein